MMLLASSPHSGITAPLTQSTCNSDALKSHFSVIVITMNSRATSAKPKSKGKAMNDVKRTSLRSARNCRPLSPLRSTNTGWATV